MSRLRCASYHHGDLRAALLDQVGRIIRERGVGVVSIREVARRARVSHGAPAHHFGSKAGLLTAFAVQGFERLADDIQTTIAGAATPPEELAAMGRAYVTFAIDNPEHFGVMFLDGVLDPTDAAYKAAADRCFGPLVDVIRRAAQAGYVVDDPMVVAASAWSIVHGLASLWLSGRIRERTGATDAAVLADNVTGLFANRVMTKTPNSQQKS